MSIHYSWCQEMYNNNSLYQFWVAGKPACLIIRLLFGFASDLSNSTKYLQVVRWQCCLRLVEWCTYSGRRNSDPFVNVVYGQCQVMYTTAPTYSLLAGIERLTQKHEISKLWFQLTTKREANLWNSEIVHECGIYGYILCKVPRNRGSGSGKKTCQHLQGKTFIEWAWQSSVVLQCSTFLSATLVVLVSGQWVSHCIIGSSDQWGFRKASKSSDVCKPV